MDINIFEAVELSSDCFLGFYISGRYLRGVAINLPEPTCPLIVDISVNGHLMASIRCIGIIYGNLLSKHIPEDYQESLDLHREIPGGFEFFLSDYLPLGSPMNISIRARIEQTEYSHIRKTIDIGSCTFQHLEPLIDARPLIRFNVLEQNENFLIVNASCSAIELDQISLRGDNCELSELTSYHFHPHYVFPEKIKSLRLTARLEITRAELEAKVYLTKNGVPFGNYSDALFIPAHLNKSLKNAAIPIEEQIDRVMASKSKLDYFFSGYASFKTIKHLLLKYTPVNSTSDLTILDWGVGCGRVARHFIDSHSQVVGIDIDPQNVSWCRQNLSGRFECISPNPPTNLLSNSIDLVFGISIFTHLTEEDQFKWLNELHRVVKSGGLAIMTIQSEYALLRCQEPARRMLGLNERGIDDAVIGTRLDDVVGRNSSYYRETFHRHQYVFQHWSKWFDILAIEIGEHFSHQDYVIMRAR